MKPGAWACLSSCSEIKAVTISSVRGKAHKLEDGSEAWVTVHPSFLLRVRDDREAEYAKFVADLRRIGERVKELA